MERDHYVIRGGVEGRERLRILARVMRPTTCSLFDRVRIDTGMACLDVGCGGGDVTFDLARRVGPGGSVVGCDIDETKLGLARREAEEQGLANVDFQLSDIGHGGEADREFDAVYARFLLTHLKDPAEALTGMRQMLRPGGVAIVEDIDFTGYFCHPDAAALWRYVELYTEAVRRRGGDANIGPRLPGLHTRPIICQSVLSQLPWFLLVEIVFHSMAVYTVLFIPSAEPAGSRARFGAGARTAAGHYSRAAIGVGRASCSPSLRTVQAGLAYGSPVGGFTWSRIDRP